MNRVRTTGSVGTLVSTLLVSGVLFCLAITGCTTSAPAVPYATGDAIQEWRTGLNEWRRNNPQYTEYIVRSGTGGPHRTEAAARRAAVTDATHAFMADGTYEGPAETLLVQTIQKTRGSRFYWLAHALVGVNPRQGEIPGWLYATAGETVVRGIGVGRTPEGARAEARASIRSQLSHEGPDQAPYRETSIYRSQDGLFWVHLEADMEELQHDLVLIRERIRAIAEEGPDDAPLGTTIRFLTNAYRTVDRSPAHAVATMVLHDREVSLKDAIRTTAQNLLDSITLEVSPEEATIVGRDAPDVFLSIYRDAVPVRATVPLTIGNTEAPHATGVTFTHTGTTESRVPFGSLRVPAGRSTWRITLDTDALGLNRVPDSWMPDVPEWIVAVHRRPPRVTLSTDPADSLEKAELARLLAAILADEIRLVDTGPADYTVSATLRITREQEHGGILFLTGALHVSFRDNRSGDIMRYSRSATEGGRDHFNARSRLHQLLKQEMIRDETIAESIRDEVLSINYRERKGW